MRTARQQRERVQQVRNSAGLTVTKATRDARRIVDAAMPGVQMITVSTRRSYDFDVQADVMITTITFPETADASDVACWAQGAPGVIRSTWSTCSIVVTRKVK